MKTTLLKKANGGKKATLVKRQSFLKKKTSHLTKNIRMKKISTVKTKKTPVIQVTLKDLRKTLEVDKNHSSQSTRSILRKLQNCDLRERLFRLQLN